MKQTIETYENGVLVSTSEYEVPPEQVNRDALHDAVKAHLVNLRSIRDSTGTLTGAQLSNAVRVLALGQIRLMRLAVGLLDGTD